MRPPAQTNLISPPEVSLWTWDEHWPWAVTSTNGGGTVRWMLDYTQAVRFKLRTGGKRRSTLVNLYQLSGWAYARSRTNVFDWHGAYVASNTIQVLGRNLDAQGELWAALPDNQDVDVTPKVPARCYTNGLSQQKYRLVSVCAAPSPPGPEKTNRFDVGVGEYVDLGFDPSVPTNLTWSVTEGSLSVTNGDSTRWTAPSNAFSVTLTVRAAGQECTRDYQVREPSGVDHANWVEYWSYNPYPPLAGAGMHIRPFIGPTNVSFYRVQVWEVGEAASGRWGYFNSHTPPSHIGNGANVWIDLDYDNHWKDVGSYTVDWAKSYAWPTTWSDGEYTWNIPAWWRIPGGNTNSLTGWNQVHNISANGTMTVRKFGHTVSRTIQNVYSHSRESWP